MASTRNALENIQLPHVNHTDRPVALERASYEPYELDTETYTGDKTWLSQCE